MAVKKTKINKMAYEYKPKDKEWGTSLAIPDESFTIRQMLHRHANGINFDNVKTPYYEEQASFSSKSIHELQKLDPTDKLQYLEKHEAQTKALRLKIQQHEDEKKAQKQLNEVKETTTTNQTTTTTNITE